MGIPVIVSRLAPTELVVKLAYQLGITVVGFAGRTGSVYIPTINESQIKHLKLYN
ncbi:Protein FdhD [Pelotomaculum propionicicum]|uniref:Protein FdhD n=1 Tax=Pelotomaculum propionicicum TaxID=258475 RepID=A0A4Y7RSL7_9FIRM|nr:Protein FdhD [Pelotomaculum propionicicum]